MAAERLGRVEVRSEADHVSRLLGRQIFVHAQDGKYSVREEVNGGVSSISGAPGSLREAYAFLRGMALVLEGKA